MNRERRSVLHLITIGAAVAGLLTGCAEKKEGDWYDNARTVQDQKEAFIAEQIADGMDPLEANKAWGLEHSVRQTHRATEDTHDF